MRLACSPPHATISPCAGDALQTGVIHVTRQRETGQKGPEPEAPNARIVKPLRRVTRSMMFGGRMGARITMALLVALIAQKGAGETLYDITFSQFPAGSEYTNASGPPWDFSSYGRGWADYAQVVSNFAGLPDQPLLSMTTGVSSRSVYTMDAQGYTNHVLTLSLDISLEAPPPESNGPTAEIGFCSETGVGAEETAVQVLLGWSLTNGGSPRCTHAEVVSREGPNYLPTILFATNSSFVRGAATRLDIAINTRSHEFWVHLGGASLAGACPFGSSQEIVRAAVAVGFFYPPYGAGAGIDNIRLNVESAMRPYLSSAAVLDSALSIGATNLTIGSTNHLLFTPSLTDPAWATASTFEATSTSTNWTKPLSGWQGYYRLRSD